MNTGGGAIGYDQGAHIYHMISPPPPPLPLPCTHTPRTNGRLKKIGDAGAATLAAALAPLTANKYRPRVRLILGYAEWPSRGARGPCLVRSGPAPITPSTLRTGAVTPGPDIPKSPPRPGHARRHHPPETAARNSDRTLVGPILQRCVNKGISVSCAYRRSVCLCALCLCV